MFPFTYTKTLKVEYQSPSPPDLQPLFDVFLRKYANAEMAWPDPDTIRFNNFRIIAHRWLDGGTLKLLVKENKIEAHLPLEFYSGSGMMLFIIAGVLVTTLVYGGEIWIPFFVAFLFSLFLGLCFAWTTVAFRISVSNAIREFEQERWLQDTDGYIPPEEDNN